MKNRIGVALATALALLVATAIPASANPEPAAGEIKGGTVVITQDPPDDDFEFDLGGPAEEDPCEHDWWPPTIDMTIDKKGTTYDVQITGSNFPKGIAQAANGDWYQVDLDIFLFGQNGGTIDPVQGTWTQSVALIATLYNHGQDPPPCEKDPIACTVLIQATLSGAYNAGPPQSGTLSTVAAGGDPLVLGACPDPFLAGALANQTVSLHGLSVNIAKS